MQLRGTIGPERGAQPSQRLREIAQRQAIGLVGPEQRSERGAGVGPVGLDRKVGQQGTHLLATEVADGSALAGYLEAAKEVECDRMHKTSADLVRGGAGDPQSTVMVRDWSE